MSTGEENGIPAAPEVASPDVEATEVAAPEVAAPDAPAPVEVEPRELNIKIDKYNGDSLGTGRRKSSVARVRVRNGSGNITINGRDLDSYFAIEQDRKAVTDVLDAVEKRDSLDVVIRVSGGGTTGQAGACRMGVARALLGIDASFYGTLREHGFMTRDARMKERKKPGLHGARRGTQFSKR